MSPSEKFSEADLIARFPQGTVIGTPDFNRIAATQSMIDLFAKKDPSAVDRYFKTPYINHTTRAGEGIEPVYGLAQLATTWQGMHTIVRRALAEDDLVVLHSVYSNLGGTPAQFVAFDLFRLDDGKIVEHWDVLEETSFPDECGLGQTGGSVDITDIGQEEVNRAVVTNFVETVLVQGKTGDVDDFIDTASYIDHSAQRPAGMNRTQCVFASEPDAPGVSYLRLHKTLAEGNFVLVQGEARIGAAQVLEVYDLFRLQAGKIVEHWDALQALPPAEQWNNANGPF